MKLDNDGVSVLLDFRVPRLDRMREPSRWTQAACQPYIDAAVRWLEVVDGVRDRPRHTLRLDIFEGHLPPGDDGYAWIYPHGIERHQGNLLPTHGAISTSARIVDRADAERFASMADWHKECHATLLHEIGHVLGIGLLWNLGRRPQGIVRTNEHPDLRRWVCLSDVHQGPIYRRPAAVRAYNQLVAGDFDFVPIDWPDFTHPFDHNDDNTSRHLPDGQQIPPVTCDVMAEGKQISVLSAGFLADLGWVVDVDAVAGAED